MSLIVQKFGGTSVADLERIRHVAKRVVSTYEQKNDVVVDSKPEIRTDAEAAVVRFSPEGQVTYVAVSRGLRLTCGDVEVVVPENGDFVERAFTP